MRFAKGNGYAKGKGRPKGSVDKKNQSRKIAEAKALDFIKDKILKQFKPLIEAKIQLALGIKVNKKIPGTDFKVTYELPPDSKSLEYLLSLVVGKPVENMNMNVQGEIAVPKIEFIYEGKGNVKNSGDGKHKDKGDGKRKAKK